MIQRGANPLGNTQVLQAEHSLLSPQHRFLQAPSFASFKCDTAPQNAQVLVADQPLLPQNPCLEWRSQFMQSPCLEFRAFLTHPFFFRSRGAVLNKRSFAGKHCALRRTRNRANVAGVITIASLRFRGRAIARKNRPDERVPWVFSEVQLVECSSRYCRLSRLGLS